MMEIIRLTIYLTKNKMVTGEDVSKSLIFEFLRQRLVDELFLTIHFIKGVVLRRKNDVFYKKIINSKYSVLNRNAV